MEAQQNTASRVVVVYEANRKDNALAAELEQHLKALYHQSRVQRHTQVKVRETQDMRHVENTLDQAAIVLLLISPDFLSSDLCCHVMEKALELSKRQEMAVVPVLLRPAPWGDYGIARFQCVPANEKWVTNWRKRDEAFTTIINELKPLSDQLSSLPLVMVPLSEKVRPLPAQEQRYREYLLKRISTVWIENLLEPLLQNSVFISLDLLERPDAVINSWGTTVQETVRHERLLANAAILDTYKEADGKLLILGEPGAGKTTLLLELTRILLDKAIDGEHCPIPIFLHLASWSSKYASLTSWFVKELQDKYGIPPKIAQQWIKELSVVLLLDGLDEVKPGDHLSCIDAINNYLQENGLASLVVCSRSDSYFAQQKRLALQQAVVIQPLTDQQITRYLARTNKLEVVQAALSRDEKLHKLATSPLMLNILRLTEINTLNADVLPSGLSQRSLFMVYVRKMLKRRGVSSSYKDKQTDDWLTWLAQQMQEHNQVLFSPGHVQPAWLPKGWMRMAYYVFFSLLGALLLGLTLTLTGAITGGSLPGWILSLVGVLSGGSGFAFASARIRPVEIIRPALVRRRILTLLSFVAIWVFLLFASVHGNLLGRFGTAMIVLSLVPLLIGEFIREQPGASLHPLIVKPGDSLRRSLQSGVSIGLLAGTSFSLIVALLYFIGLLQSDIFIGVVLALLLGLLSGLTFGGLAALQLGVLYWLLRYSKRIPPDYVSFLDYAVERLLLRKVGSGYMFIHPLWQDYFASSHTELMDCY